MHFDPVGPDSFAPSDSTDFTSDDVVAQQARSGDPEAQVETRRPHIARTLDDDRDSDDDGDRPYVASRRGEDDEVDEVDELPRRTPREGLPARFRMRHASHYVDQLLGDAPLRTVREIPLSEIEGASDDGAEIGELAESVRRLGVIEPLLVSRQGATYRVIAGMRRLRAAGQIGLNAVPCLVQEVDEDRLAAMRTAAAQRVVIPEPEPTVPEVEERLAPTPEPTIGEAALGLEFVAALLPAMNAAGQDRLRWGVLSDLASVELARTKMLGAAKEALRSSGLSRASADAHALVSAAVSAVSTEARLRNVRLDFAWGSPELSPEISLDAARCHDALVGMLQAQMTLAPRAGSTLHVAARITHIRPALIVEARLLDCDPGLGREAVARFFEADWAHHPCGQHGTIVLAALAHVARAHGGRVDVKASASGCVVTFVVPR